MEKDIKTILIEHKISQIYNNNLSSIKSISEHLNIWENYSDNEKLKLENLTKSDSRINRNFKFEGKYDNNLSYSEITKKGTETLIEKIIRYKNISDKDVFVDIGSGCGKVVLHVALKTNIKTLIGIEKVSQRNLYAKKIYEQVSPISDKSIFLIEKDIIDFDLSKSTIIFINDISFDDKIMDRIIGKIPKNCHVITSHEMKDFKLKEKFQIDTSWSNEQYFMYYYIK